MWQALCKNTGPSSIGSTMSLFLKVKVESAPPPSVSELKSRTLMSIALLSHLGLI